MSDAAIKVNEVMDADDPQDFINRMPARRAKVGQACSVVCPQCGAKKTLLKNWDDDLEDYAGGQDWGSNCACGHFLPYNTYFAESAEDVNPEHYLDTAFKSPVPGYTIERCDPLPAWGAVGQQPFAVYNLKGAFLGHILYDPMDDKPPEASPVWDNVHWIGSVGWRDGETRYTSSFEEAALFVINFRQPPAQKVAEALLETDLGALDDPERYVQQAAIIPLPGYQVEVPPGPGVFQIYATDFQGRYGYNTGVGTIYDMARYECDPDYPPHWPTTPRWLAMYRSNPEDTKNFDDYNSAFAWLDAKRKADPKRKHFGVTESDIPDDEDALRDYANSTEIGVGSLRTELRKMYDYVGVHVRPATIAIYQEQKTWIVTCRRSTAMPVPQRMDAVQLKNLVEHWLVNWANQNGLHLCWGIEFHGFLRKNVTLKFDTAVQGARIGRRHENADDVDPEALMPGFLEKIEWKRELYDLMWQFHPTGVTYQVEGNTQAAIIVAMTYFDPAKDDFANRFYDFIQSFFQQRHFKVTILDMWTNPRKNSSYPEWSVLLVLNVDFRKSESKPPLRSLDAPAAP